MKIFEKLNLISLKYDLYIITDIENKKNNKYLYSNLIGNKGVVIEILIDFEINEKL